MLPGGHRAPLALETTGHPSAPSQAANEAGPCAQPSGSGCGESARGPARPCNRFNDNRLYERFKSEARKAYTRSYGSITDDQWDAAFNMSYWKLYQLEMRSPGEVEHPASWIATAAKNEIISDYRRTARQTPLEDPDALEDRCGCQDALAKIEQHHLLHDVSFILNMLPARQRRVWSARFVWDYHPQEIQQNMGISQKAYEKALQQATTFLLGRLERARQGVCETPEMESLIRGYAIWGERHYSPERRALARAHLDDCAACRHTAWLIRHQVAEDEREQEPPAPRPVGSMNRVRLASRNSLAGRRPRVLA
jgi:RNA polymerase sigma factor (sigma-70 family)